MRSKLRQFIVAYVMYRWLETKLPEQAAVYRERAEKTIAEVKNLLNSRIKLVRRWHGYW